MGLVSLNQVCMERLLSQVGDDAGMCFHWLSAVDRGLSVIETHLFC